MKMGAFGEVMLRLTPPDYLLLEQGHTIRMEYTGTGVNILGNLAHFGLSTWMLTNVPDNRLGDAAKANLRQLGMNTDFVGKYHNHMGIYFAEVGYGARPTYVTYQNRHSSSFGVSKPENYPFEEFLNTVDLVHICGISLSLTEETWLSARDLAKAAHSQGKKVCFDFNFRPSLNTEEGKKALMKARYEEILPYCDVVFGSVRDLTELLMLSDQPMVSEKEEIQLIQNFLASYDIEWFAATRRIFQVDKQLIAGRIVTKDKAIETEPHSLKVLDRIGAGDAYASGVLLGYAEGWSLEKTAKFATTNTVLAHTMMGDVSLTTREQVEQVIENPGIDILR